MLRKLWNFIWIGIIGVSSNRMNGGLTSKERNEERRSKVRVWVTYAATTYIFLGSAVLIAALWIDKLPADKLTIARDVFMMVLPVATGVVTYWFASRKPDETRSEESPRREVGAAKTELQPGDDDAA